MRNSIICGILALMFMSAPHADAAPVKQKEPLFPMKHMVSATTTTSQHGTVGIYTLVFDLEATGENVYLPAQASRMSRGLAIGNTGVLYDIYESDLGRHSKGLSGAILTSDAARTDGFYVIPKGETRRFTLIVGYGNRGVENDHYQVRIEGIRYALRGANRTIITEKHGFAKFKSKEVSLLSE